MCLQVARKSGTSLRRCDELRKTVPDRRTGNRKAVPPQANEMPKQKIIIVHAGGPVATTDAWSLS